MPKKLLLLGGGGYCKQVIEILLEEQLYDEIGIIEKDGSDEKETLGVPVIGFDSNLQELFHNGWTDAVVTLGSIGNTSGRRELYRKLKNIGYTIPAIVSKQAVVARSSRLQEGCIVHQGAIIDADAEVGVCSIINKRCVLSHDCHVGNFVHVSPGCVLLGNVRIGNDSHIGATSCIREGIQIGNETMIGMGSIVVKNIPNHKVAYGNPCVIMKDK